MVYWKSKDISSQYDLISDNMTLYPVVFEKHTWYHCNLLGQKRDLACPSSVLIFVEVKCKWEPTTGRSYDVVSCIMLDEKNSYNCKVCPPPMDIMHPLQGGFTRGSKDEQKRRRRQPWLCCWVVLPILRFLPSRSLRCPSSPVPVRGPPLAVPARLLHLAAAPRESCRRLNPSGPDRWRRSNERVPCSSPCHNEAATLSSSKPSTTMMKPTAATSCSLLGLDNCSRLEGKQGIGSDPLKPSNDSSLNIIGQLIM